LIKGTNREAGIRISLLSVLQDMESRQRRGLPYWKINILHTETIEICRKAVPRNGFMTKGSDSMKITT
jgi:hypothetical protein